MNEPLLSVLLPCCNGASTVGLALHSLLVQTFADFEILFLNDGSSDESTSIAASFADSRIRVLGDSRRLGLPIRLNQGVELAKGRFIARMDADDISFPERFEKQVAYLQAHPEVDLVGCRTVVFRDHGETIGLLPFAATHTRLCAQPWRNIPLPHPSWMGRRSWFQSYPYRLPEVRRAEDQELLLRSCKDSRFACLEDVLLAYRQGPFQLERTLIARCALLSAQVGLFCNRHEWSNVALALASAAAKVSVDCLSALPGLQKLFFARMGEPVSENIQHQLSHCLAQYGARRP
jgi:glycosyltransferase involved in cell wall biosynthesis